MNESFRHKNYISTLAGNLSRHTKWTPISAQLVPFLMMLNCSFEEPFLPEWSVAVNIPLSKETFIPGDRTVKDSIITVQGADSLLFISLESELDTLDLADSEFNTGRYDTTQIFELGTLNNSFSFK